MPSPLLSLRPTRARLLAGGLCLLLGLAVAVQVRQRTGADLAGLRQSELLGLLSDATNRSDRLQREIDVLQAQQRQLRTATDARAAARALAQQRLDTLGLLAGTLPATGPGIVMRVQLPTELAAGSPHRSSVVLGAVEELRDAGAEAIAISGASASGTRTVRVVADTSFTDPSASPVPQAGSGSGSGTGTGTGSGAGSANAVAVGSPSGTVVQRSPLTITAIGDPQTLASAMNFPDGVVATLRQIGGSASVRPTDTVDITAVQGAARASAARPVTPGNSPTP